MHVVLDGGRGEEQQAALVIGAATQNLGAVVVSVLPHAAAHPIVIPTLTAEAGRDV